MTAILPTNPQGIVTADTIRTAVGVEPKRTWPVPGPPRRRVSRPAKPVLAGTITTGQVAALAGVDPAMVRRWARQGKFSTARRGSGQIGALYAHAEVLAWLDQRAAKKRGAR